MRQSCTLLEKKKSLIIFILAAIIFTYGYEGIISSLLTAPPPVFVFPTLRDLIDSDYKIIGYRPDVVLQEICKNENISIDAILPADGLHRSNEGAATLLSYCNTTMKTGTTDSRRIYERNNPGLKFHTTLKNTYTVSSMVYFFFGPLHVALSSITRRFLESGILVMYKDLSDHFIGKLRNLPVIREEIHAEEKRSREVPFAISEWKMLSMFIIWAFLLGTSSLVFVFELLISGFNVVVSVFISHARKLVLFNYH